HAQIRDNTIYHTDTSQWQRALFDDFMLAVSGYVLHQDNNALDSSHQIHGAAHALDHLARNHPVGQITLLGDLHRPEDGQINMATTNHGKAFRVVEKTATRQRSDRLLASVNQIR